ncbi:DUF2798 domain-containing protein [Clostridium cellulovorans]|uniref:DUF2798 domain-containing protein n=1 Tax=Clostridium cellulovorans (strain ATCC 35296 / DSM 3052 / OCM 3 / 743B) TaxID=573061 RepID=D9SNB4_CLOC7|nr:DUF2798 domain-containing protein [Clostridium cellulovorans]ADL53906.1 Protein of unknown function DUF2798 [Clostridium cellulovorans 743B]
MGKNKRENFIFTLICCTLMVLGMDAYNVLLRNGVTTSFLKDVLIGFVPVFCIALFIDWFFVGKVAKSFVSKLVTAESPLIKKILLTSFFMVCGMCFSMSLITSIIHQGISTDFLINFVQALSKNFLFALPLQLVIVGPIARAIFFKLYPVV